MHELPVTQSIVNICSEEAEKNNAKHVSKITLKIGELSGLVPDCIQYYFDIISEKTIVQGAELNIEKVPVRMVCNSCGYEGDMNLETFDCPKCKSKDVKTVGGKEFYIDTMEVDDIGN